MKYIYISDQEYNTRVRVSTMGRRLQHLRLAAQRKDAPRCRTPCPTRPTGTDDRWGTDRGRRPPVTVEGTTDGEVCRVCVKQVLGPTLKTGDIGVLESAVVHALGKITAADALAWFAHWLRDASLFSATLRAVHLVHVSL